ncbi:RbsD/FucU family protein [Shimia sp. R11_0]|uniref:RbsD/FucU family protein n=1 Tax=Shimia sp. R11_0 TaxID=2821096 RepID=UPI001ADB6884|nr:RbsD/FucU family protein [Shimia sp. R11_0]MBO9477877.1 RbsD/FucU family protein [Shimia sp. R11_0]
MLRNINPLLSPDLLHCLRAMGHGDEIVIADANFPGSSSGPTCLRADGSSASEILEAVLSVMPLDSFVPDPALTMQVVGDPDALPEAVSDFQRIIDATADNPVPVQTLERFAFYARAASAFAVVQTGERRLYGNIILKKGVIG